MVKHPWDQFPVQKKRKECQSVSVFVSEVLEDFHVVEFSSFEERAGSDHNFLCSSAFSMAFKMNGICLHYSIGDCQSS